MREFFVRRWFLFALLLAILGGIFCSRFAQVRQVTELWQIRYAIVSVVLFVMAFPLQARAMWQSLRRPQAPLLAIGINYLVLPLAGWLCSFLLPPDLSIGLLVASTTPSTLASAAVWTRRAGGNDAVALLVTVGTNLTCFAVTPLWLFVMTGVATESRAFDLGPMVVKLAAVVVLPMVAAQLLRQAGSCGDWATRHKTPLGVIAQIGILSMIFLGSVRTGINLFSPDAAPLAVTDIALMIGIVLTVHLSMFVFGMIAAGVIGLAREDCIAVGFSGSQKTLMVGLQVSMDLGVSILPMVAYHVGQLLVDTVIADRLRAQAAAEDKPGRPRDDNVEVRK